MSKTIRLTRGQEAIVDDEDFDRLNQFKWQAIPGGNTFYAMRHVGQGKGQKSEGILMHREVMRTPKGMQGHHRNGNGLDNRKANLRNVTRQQNLQGRRLMKNNKCGYKGVHLDRRTNKWRMNMFCNFDTPTEAARAYDKCARLLYGEHALLNFPDEK